jgi:DNA polymerase
MVVGEAPGSHEEQQGAPFVGPAGWCLEQMLRSAGIDPQKVFFTNVARVRPPSNDITAFIASTKAGKPVTSAKSKCINKSIHRPLKGLYVTRELYDGYKQLKSEISSVRPNIIIPVGNVSMWALTGLSGIKKWRGSMLYTDIPYPSASGTLAAIKVIPTYHPAYVLRDWSARNITVADLRRASHYVDGRAYQKPRWNFEVRPTYEQVVHHLTNLRDRVRGGERIRLSVDIETRAGHIACIGISYTAVDAICIPLMCVGSQQGYWGEDQESSIAWLLYQLLTHSNALVVMQNGLYDCQYFLRHLLFCPNVIQDTMISQHSIFSDMRKSLDFQASMYAQYYVYWKDEGKNIDPASVSDESQWWTYNCLDCVYTDEVGLVELETVEKLNLIEVHSFQQEMFWPVLRTMQRGIRIDRERRNQLIMEVQDAIDKRLAFLTAVLGHPLNPDSSKQMHTLFYTDLRLPVQRKRATKGKPGNITLDDEALNKLVRMEPLIKPLVNCVLDIRTLGKFLSNFLCRSLDHDGRMRCSYNIGGSESGASAPKTYRLSSSENAFGSGTNLQNIPSKKSKSMGKAAARGAIAGLGDPYKFPNIREIFIPDPGYTWFDMDLERADLFTVCWEANDEQLKAAMRLGVDIHLLNAFIITGKEPPPLEELVETHNRYEVHRGPHEYTREFAKVFCHGTNFGGQPRTMAAHTGRSIVEIERAQSIWFSAHPGIRTWHKRVAAQISARRYVENRFGYRWYIFDRVENALNEAIGWIPQSHTSIVINKIWERIHREIPEVEILMQVHDSLPGQMPTARVAELLPRIRECAKVTIPYEDPLIIPVNIKTSTKSWGHC